MVKCFAHQCATGGLVLGAASELQRAFAQRADGLASAPVPLIGYFGDGIALPIIQAAGAICADVKAPPLADAENGVVVPSVAEVAEPFLDDFTARFLHRFASGALAQFDLIVFARDDVAGLAAYQYAQELRRQGLVSKDGPRLFLWNLVHTDSAAAHRFNMLELANLRSVLSELGLKDDDAHLAKILDQERKRRALVESLVCSAADRFVFRNAGRWLTPGAHISALEQVSTQEPADGQRHVGLVGNANDLALMRELCGQFGHLSVDLQPFGDVWDYDIEAVSDAESLVRAIAQNPLHVRTSPAENFGAVLRTRLAKCDLVVATLDRNDDSFGWEVPELKKFVKQNGGRFVDLGFMPFRPDRVWLAAARAQIQEVLQQEVLQ